MTARCLSATPNAYTENPTEEGEPVTIERLVHMANQVAAFSASYPDPRMRREIEAHLNEKAGAGLSHIALEAVKRIARKDAAAKKSA